MKKALYLTMSVLIVALASCTKEDEPNDDNVTPDVNAIPTATNTADPAAASEAEAKVIGGWTAMKVLQDSNNDGTVNQDVTANEDLCEYPDVTFTANGALEFSTRAGCPGKTDTVAPGYTFDFLNGNQMILTYTEEDSSGTFTYSDTLLCTVTDDLLVTYEQYQDSSGVMINGATQYIKL